MDGMYESAKQFGFDDWYPKLDEYLNGFIQDKESPGYYMARNQTQPYGSCIMPAACPPPPYTWVCSLESGLSALVACRIRDSFLRGKIGFASLRMWHGFPAAVPNYPGFLGDWPSVTVLLLTPQTPTWRVIGVTSTCRHGSRRLQRTVPDCVPQQGDPRRKNFRRTGHGYCVAHRKSLHHRVAAPTSRRYFLSHSRW
jgi:hypothetical protein